MVIVYRRGFDGLTDGMKDYGCCNADGVPPVQQERGLPAALEGLPDRVPFSGGYRYVLFHFWFITITRRSLSVAIAASCLTFVALQACSVTCHQQPFIQRPCQWCLCFSVF